MLIADVSYSRNPTDGMPDIVWKPNSTNEKWYLKINNDLQLVKGEILQERFNFWKHIYAASATGSKY